MGQYYKVVNLDKRQCLSPWAFGDGAKLLEFGCSADGVMCGLVVLLADGNGRGGGDLHVPDDAPEELSSLVGSWAGDRIVVSGDYADKGRFVLVGNGVPANQTDRNLYDLCSEEVFEDISESVVTVMCYDCYLKQDLAKRMACYEPDDDRIPDVLKDEHAKARRAWLKRGRDRQRRLEKKRQQERANA